MVDVVIMFCVAHIALLSLSGKFLCIAAILSNAFGQLRVELFSRWYHLEILGPLALKNSEKMLFHLNAAKQGRI